MVSEALQSACDNAIRVSRRGDTRTGMDLARHAYRLARQEGPEAELEALNASALCQAANGSFIESIATSIDIVNLARQHSHRRAAAYALTTMAAATQAVAALRVRYGLEPARPLIPMKPSLAEQMADRATLSPQTRKEIAGVAVPPVSRAQDAADRAPASVRAAGEDALPCAAAARRVALFGLSEP